MTVASETSKSGPYEGDGANTSFTYAFKILHKNDILVTHTASDGAETVLDVDVDYTVNNVGSATGTVDYPISGSPLAAGEYLTLSRDMTFTQEVDLDNQGGYYPETVETVFDRMEMKLQQVKEASDRAVVVPISSSSTPENYLTTIEVAKSAAQAAAAAAAASETAAGTSETNAAASESAAATSVTNAAASETAAAASASAASTSATSAANSAGLAGASQTAAWESAGEAAISETNAAASETAAAASETAAAASETAAATSETNAATSETNAAASAAAAAASATQVEDAKLEWQGAWSSLTTYAINDAVEHNGTAYIATAASTNQAPPNASYWDVLVAGGLTAASTVFSPASGVVATDVQAAIEEVENGAAPNKNFVINGSFDIWQRGVSASTSALFAYSADRWRTRVTSGTGVTREAFTLGQTDVEGEPTYFLRLDADAASTSTAAHHRIEDVRTLAGESVTLSLYMKADSAQTVNVKTTQNFGTGGSPSTEVSVNSTNKSVTTSWQRFEISFTMPSISGKTLGTDGNHFVGIEITGPSTTAVQLDIAQVKFEKGSKATDFEREPFVETYNKCLRYYENNYPNGSYPGDVVGDGTGYGIVYRTPTGSAPYHYVPFKAMKRAAPTITTWNGVNGNSNEWRGSSAVDWSTTASAVNWGFNVGLSTTADDELIRSGYFEADAEL